MDAQPDPRHVARAVALQILFHRWNASGSTGGQPQPEDLMEALEAEKIEETLLGQLTTGIDQSLPTIDAAITKLAPAWPIEQIAPVDLVILRIAIWEGFIQKLNPSKVVINEAIELAKEFGGANSSSFVNGVLGSLLKNEELQQSLINNTRTLSHE